MTARSHPSRHEIGPDLDDVRLPPVDRRVPIRMMAALEQEIVLRTVDLHFRDILVEVDLLLQDPGLRLVQVLVPVQKLAQNGSRGRVVEDGLSGENQATAAARA